jgi:predicted double-glycine peptidase
VLRDYGYDVTYTAAIDERPLTEALTVGLSPIVLLHTQNLSYWERETAHAVIVVGMDARMVYLNDPAFPDAPMAISRIEFLLAWSDFDMLYAIIRPKGLTNLHTR